jgi:hypothetical protein
MVHWTLLPEQLIYENSQGQNEIPAIHETVVDGVHMLVEQTGAGIKVVRLLSPDPSHYLDSRFQPGNLLYGISIQPKG